MILTCIGCAMIGASLKGWNDGPAGTALKYMLQYKLKEVVK